MALKVGDKIDVLYIDDDDDSATNSSWYIAIVIAINEQQVQIHYICDEDDHTDDTWLEKTSHRLATLNSHTLPIVKLPKSPRSGNSTHAMFYKDKHKQYILVCISGLKAIYRYDINQQKWTKYCNYPLDFDVSADVAVCFDDTKKIIHIISTIPGAFRYVYGIFDINKFEWTIRKNDRNDALNSFHLGFLSKNINELHLFERMDHYQILTDTVNKDSFRLIQSGTVTQDSLNAIHDLTFNEEYQILAMYDKQNALGIHSYEITTDESMSYKWNISPALMNFGKKTFLIDTCKLVIGFKHILFVFVASTLDIWCIDLLNGGKYKSARPAPHVIPRRLSIVKTGDNFIHLIHCGWQTNYRLWLGHIIPNELKKVYIDKICNPLVFGYIANINKQNNLSHSIPYDVANIILVYTPAFL